VQFERFAHLYAGHVEQLVDLPGQIVCGNLDLSQRQAELLDIPVAP